MCVPRGSLPHLPENMRCTSVAIAIATRVIKMKGNENPRLSQLSLPRPQARAAAYSFDSRSSTTLTLLRHAAATCHTRRGLHTIRSAGGNLGRPLFDSLGIFEDTLVECLRLVLLLVVHQHGVLVLKSIRCIVIARSSAPAHAARQSWLRFATRQDDVSLLKPGECYM